MAETQPIRKKSAARISVHVRKARPGDARGKGQGGNGVPTRLPVGSSDGGRWPTSPVLRRSCPLHIQLTDCNRPLAIDQATDLGIGRFFLPSPSPFPNCVSLRRRICDSRPKGFAPQNWYCREIGQSIPVFGGKSAGARKKVTYASRVHRCVNCPTPKMGFPAWRQGLGRI